MNDKDPLIRKRMRDEIDTLFTMYSEYKLVYYFMGYIPVSWRQFQLCVGVLWASHMFMMAMACYSTYMVLPNIGLSLASVHTIALAIFAQWSFLTIVIGSRDTLKIVDKIKDGIYIYDEEDTEIQKERIRVNMAKELKWKFDQVKYIYFVGFLTNAFLFSLSQIIFYDEEKDDYPIFINPHLVHVFYNPFNSRSIVSNIVTFIIHLLFVIFVYAICLRLLGMYAACAMNMKVHFDILNDSIRNVRSRAYKMYLKLYGFKREPISKENIYKTNDFSKCLFYCLRANILHHQALLKFKEDSGFIIGNLFLQVFILAAIVYAAILYQLYQTLPINVYINYLATFLAEQGYTFFLCALGEEVITSSSHVFLSLYSVKWFNFDEIFKQTLLITMMNTRLPVEYRALIMNVPASIVTFSNNLSIMYKITNVVQQSDILN